MGRSRRNVLLMNGADAKAYFMRQTSYFSTALPPYFDFTKILTEVDQRLSDYPLQHFCVAGPQKFTDVNYKLFNNKDGEYAWRPLQLMHPAFYVDLVNYLTKEDNWRYLKKRLESFRTSKRVICATGFMQTEELNGDKPLEIVNWWHKVEQDSVRLALDYDFSLHTDITSCYETISEWLIAEAIEGEIGEYINRSIRYMSGGQHRGVPQGSNLMDFVAELALGYIDFRLSKELEKRRLSNGFLILRYRDDYRIFTNSPRLAEDIARALSGVLSDYGMKLNVAKTALYDDVITSSLKPDKIYWNSQRALLYIDDSGEVGEPSLQRHLMAIRELAKKYPGSGSVHTALVDIYKKRIYPLDSRPQNLDQLVSIVIDITMHNPRLFFITAAILSKFIPLYNKRAGRKMLFKIREKLSRTAYKDYFEICLQRITIKSRREETYSAALCRMVYNPNVKIWNSDWLGFTLNERTILDERIIANMDEAVPVREVDIFSPFESADAPEEV